MYWDSKEQINFIKKLDSGKFTPAALSVAFDKSLTAIWTKISTIRLRRKQMDEMGITKASLIKIIKEKKGSVSDIAETMNVQFQMVLAFIHTYPELYELLHKIQTKNAKMENKLLLKKPAPKKYAVQRLIEQIGYKERNPLREAEAVLNNRLGNHPKLGRTLDGIPVSVKKIIEAAGTGDYRMHN